MGTFRPTSFISNVISKAMFLLAFSFSGNVVYSQIALRGTSTTAINTSATVTVTKPTGVVAGDIMIANIGNYFNGTNTSATSSGWTLIAGTDVDRGRATLLYKIAGSSEPASYTFTVTASSSATTGAIVAFSGVSNTNPFDVVNPATWYTATSQTLSNVPALTTTTNNTAVVLFGNSSRLTTQTTGNFTDADWNISVLGTPTELYDAGHNNTNNTPCVGAAWMLDATAGNTGAGGMRCNANTTPRLLAGLMLALRAAPAAVVTSSANSVCGTSSINLSSVVHGNSGVSSIAFQGFESAGSTVTYAATGTGNVQSGATAASGDNPTSSNYFVSGTNGYRINNGTATITTANIGSVGNYTSKSISLNLASFSVGSTANGSDGTDNVVVAISLDGGTNWSNELQVSGNSNSYWGYASGTGVASATYDGNNSPTAYAPTAGGNRTTDGYSNLTISLPDNATQVRVRVTMLNNSTNEAWAIDNIRLSGLPTPQYSWTSSPAGFTSSAANPTSVSISATTTYNLTVTDATGFSASGSTSVTVVAAPNAGAISGTQAICVSGTTTFSSNGTAGGAWTTSDAAVATVNSSTGVVTGVAAGTATITYTVTGTAPCTNATQTRTVTVTAAPNAGTLSGTQGICVAGTTTFTSNGNAGGAWSTSNAAVATVNASTGVVTGVAAGTATITYTVTATSPCTGNATATRTVTVTTAPSAGTVSGTQSICVGGTTTFSSNGSAGGAWTSDAVGVATVNSSTGVITGVGSGTATITYTVTGTGGCSNATATRTVTVTAAPNAGTVSGTQNICVAGTTGLFSNGFGGGSWSTSNAAVATVNASNGLVTGVAAGTATITYTVPGTGGCANATSSLTVTVTAAPNAGSISGTLAICIGGTTTLTSNGNSGGTWSSNNTAAATVNSTSGVVTGVASSSSFITYTVTGTGGCANATATSTVTVTAPPNAGTVSGTQTICVGGTTALFSNGNGGGAWSTSNAAVATVNASNGLVTGVAAGTATITYTVAGTGGCANATATRTVTVTAAPNAGTLSGTQTICVGGTTTFTSNGNTGGSWTSSNTGVASVNASTGVVTGASTGSATITYTVNGSGGCTNATATRTVTVNAASVAGSIAGATSVCPDANSTVLTLSGNTGNIQWQSSTDNTSFSNINSATASTYTVTNIAAVTYYRAEVTNSICASANTASVTMNMLPVPTVTDATVCAGGSGSLQVTCADQTNQVSGPRDAGTGTNVTGIGTVAWSNPNNIAGGGTAGMSINSNATTNYLQGTNYGFAIPTNAVVNGISVTINRSSSGTTSPFLQDNRVSLVKGGTVQATNKAVLGTNWSNSGLASAVYGGSADLWGTTWTAAEINANNFGIVLSAVNANTGNSRTASVDYMSITVTYTIPGVENWYTAVSGGSIIGSGTSFNPVGVAGSGLTNTNTVGTTTYYVDCSILGNSCRAAVDFNIIQNTNAGSIAGATTVCSGTNSTVLTLSGQSGSVQWQSSTDNSTFNNISGATGNTYTATNISATRYYRVVVSQGICSNNSASVAITVPTIPAINNLTGKGCTSFAFVVAPTNVDDGVVPAGTTYTWSAPTGSGFTGGSAQNTPQANISQTLTLTGASAAVATYTVTPRVGTCVGASFTVAVTINPLPVISITADYCSVGGSAVLTATAGLSNYVWNTGNTTQSITTQQAGSYTVSASSPQGCSSTATLGVATELVTNGTFNSGNTGFITGYTNAPNVNGVQNEMYPEGTYSIWNNANDLHDAFFGTGFGGTGNFMIINGSPSLTTIWSQNNVAVQPNTTYYFSAWGLTLVSGNNAALQFSINGSQVGTVAYLANGTTSAPYPWARFYGQWNSGNNTSVNLSIVNLQLELGGNDFGLDNISFGTFAPVGLATTPVANGSGAVCAGNEFFLNANAAGGASPYTFAWTGPNGFTSNQANPSVSNNATSAINGTYNLTVTDALGCTNNSNVVVSVSALPNSVTPSAVSATVCADGSTSINIPTSETTVGYTLYNNATGQPVSATTPGNGATLSISTGALQTSTTFYVLAERYATGCERQLTPNVTVTVATTPVLVTNNIALCSGTANLTAASVTAGSTGGGTLSYWTTAAATTAVTSPSAVNTGTYYIRSAVGSCSDIEPVTVLISGTPVTTYNYTGSPFCSNAIDPAPAFSGGGSAGVFTSAAGLVFVSASTGVVDLSASTPGTYTITNTITPVGGCTPSSTSRTITITGAPNPNFSYVSNSLCQTIGGNNPLPIFPAGAQAGTFTTFAGLNLVSASTGEVNLATSTPGSYAVINTITGANGCPSASDTVFVDIQPYTFTGQVSASSSDDQLCAGETVDFFSSGTSYATILERETFNGSFTPWTTSNASTGGTPASAAWTLRPDNYNYNSNFRSNDQTQFYLSNSQAQGGGSTSTALKSPALNTIGFTTLSMDFYHFFDWRSSGDDCKVQVSTNNTTWTDLATYTSDQGSFTAFANAVINLNSYVGLPTVWVRFLYTASNDRYWAIDNVTLSGNSTRYMFDWMSTPSGFSSTAQNPANYVPTESAYYDVSVMNNYGCVINTSPFPVLVNPLPADNAGADLDICAGVAGAIGAASQAGNTYSWSPSTGLSASNVSNPTAQPSAATIYTLTQTIAATGCSDTNRVYVNVRPVSQVSNITSTVCSGSVFAVTPVNGVNGTVVNGTTYVWNAPAGSGFTGGSAQASAQNNISQTLTATGNASATATYTVTPKSNGCDGAAFTVQVDVSTAPNAGSISGGAAVCAGNNISTLIVNGSQGNLQWQSSTNNVNFNNIGGATANVYTATNLSSTNYYRVVASNSPCPVANSSSVAITTIPRPTATLSGSAEICTGSSSSLSIALTGNGPWTGTLSNGASFSASSSPAIVAVTPSSSNTYTVSTLVDNNCEATGGLNGSATINVNPLPTASITGSAVVCGGSAGAVTINGPANGQVSYTLNGNSFSAILNGSGTGTINTGTVWQNLTYSLVDVDNGLCENTATGTATITYQEAPDATISGSTQLCSGQSTSIAFSGNPNAVVTYNVNGGAAQNVTLNGSGNASVNTGALNGNTTYNLVSVAASGCSSSIGTSAVVNVGLTIYYQDNDGDGYGNSAATTVACTLPAGYATVGGDCCDSNANINPVCEWWGDMDGDGYGSFIYDVGCIAGVGCASNTWPQQLIPYCQLANNGVLYQQDCNDNSVAVNPGATEVCNNTIDDDCDGFIGEACSGQLFDQFTTAQLLTVNTTNAYYPNCQTYAGTMVNTDVSAQGNPANVAAGGGRDVWYRFVAPTTGVRIQVTASGFNPVIELRTAAHPAGQVDVENANSAVGGTEVLNYGNLVAGQTYYVGVRNYNATNVGTYTICISPLRASGCANVAPAGGFTLCNSYKVLYTAATSYTYNFTGIGGTSNGVSSSVTSLTGLITLNNASLALRYSGLYNVRIDANYALTNGLGQADAIITVLGNSVPADCQNVQMAQQPSIEVKSTQVCPTVLTRTTSLLAGTVTGSANVCGVINYTYEFTRVTDCTGANVIGSPFTVNTPSSTASLTLTAAFPAQLASTGYWLVRVRPNFNNSYAGVWGPYKVIAVGGSAGMQMLDETSGGQAVKSFETQPLSVVYPNPNNGNEININLTDIGSGELVVKIVDAVGRTIYNNRFAADGSLFTKIDFSEQLTGGIYLVEFTINGETMNERMIVER